MCKIPDAGFFRVPFVGVCMYSALNVFFFIFHTTFIVFFLSGWLWRRTRRLHLATVLLTAFSWFALGLWYGFGYCPCTDWHWRVRYHLGLEEMPPSYLKFLADALTGRDVSARLVDRVALGAFLVVLAVSLGLLVRDLARRKAPRGV